MNDLISDMLTRIRNALAVKKPSVKVVYSNVCLALAKLLKDYNFIKDFKKVKEQKKRFIKIYFEYGSDKEPPIHGLKRVSKPGQRIYKKAKELRSVRQGHGLGIISTSQGLMTYQTARKKNLGGEPLCEIW